MKETYVSIIIPNWNGQELLEDCLTSLAKQTYQNLEVLVVDNGSSDGSVEYIKEYFPMVKVLKLKKNYGFARAVNEGVKLVSSEYVVFLNNDTMVDKNWLKELVKTVQKNPQIASVNSKILNYYHRDTIDGVGIEINEVGQARSIGWQQKDDGQFASEMEIFGATGGASLFNRKIFIKVGLFDENYFMYSEEVDWAFRARFLGDRSLYCPKAIVYHKHKASAQKKPQHLEYWQFRNMTQTIIKDMPKELMLKKWRWLKIILVHFNTIFYQIKHGYFWPPLMTEVWLVINLPWLLYKRRHIQKSRSVQLEDIDKFLIKKELRFYGLRNIIRRFL